MELTVKRVVERCLHTWDPAKLAPVIDPRMYAVLGMAGEAGEVANKVKKIYRDNAGVWDEAARLAVAMEIFDTLWYAFTALHQMGFDAEAVLHAGFDKLADRQARGVVKGHGDNR
jgi:NTP pyrophosphatase (non-canonical NTP hydrolase)